MYLEFLFTALYETLDFYCVDNCDDYWLDVVWGYESSNDNSYKSYDKFHNPEDAYDKDGAPIIELYKDMYVKEHGCMDLETSSKPLGCSGEIVYEFNGKRQHTVVFGILDYLNAAMVSISRSC